MTSPCRHHLTMTVCHISEIGWNGQTPDRSRGPDRFCTYTGTPVVWRRRCVQVAERKPNVVNAKIQGWGSQLARWLQVKTTEGLHFTLTQLSASIFPLNSSHSVNTSYIFFPPRWFLCRFFSAAQNWQPPSPPPPPQGDRCLLVCLRQAAAVLCLHSYHPHPLCSPLLHPLSFSISSDPRVVLPSLRICVVWVSSPQTVNWSVTLMRSCCVSGPVSVCQLLTPPKGLEFESVSVTVWRKRRRDPVGRACEPETK